MTLPVTPDDNYAIVQQIAPNMLQLRYQVDGKAFAIQLSLSDAQTHAANILSLIRQMKRETVRQGKHARRMQFKRVKE